MVVQLCSCYQNELIEAGCDEAGRGCLAGPVFAASVILPFDYYHPVLNDSKQISENIRYNLREEIQKNALAWSVAQVDNTVIDSINILNASILAMHNAIDKLNIQPGFVLIDKNRFKQYKNIPHVCIVKGDSKYFSIAAASILAKTYRDEYMVKLHTEYPCYDWINNKGYPTQKHREAIQKTGISPYHRRTFNLFDNQLKINF